MDVKDITKRWKTIIIHNHIFYNTKDFLHLAIKSKGLKRKNLFIVRIDVSKSSGAKYYTYFESTKEYEKWILNINEYERNCYEEYDIDYNKRIKMFFDIEFNKDIIEEYDIDLDHCKEFIISLKNIIEDVQEHKLQSFIVINSSSDDNTKY